MKPLLGVQLNRSHPLAKGLVGCWVMNEGAGNKIYDLSGNGNDGSFPGGTANPLWKPGRTGPALKFDGVNDYVEKTSFTQITSAITISAWIYPNTYGSHANGLGRMVTGGLSGSAKYSFALNKDFSGLGTNNLIFNDGDEWEVSNNNTISLNTWQHVVITNDGNTVTFYIDGQSSGGNTGTHTMPSGDVTLRIGEAKKGNKQWNYKGGVTPEHKRIRQSIDFRLWREAVFARDNWTCAKCNTKGGRLHPHHLMNFAQYPELRFAIDNGITFCSKCHMEFHKIFGLKDNDDEQVEVFIK